MSLLLHTVHFRCHKLANFSEKWLLPGRWQESQEAGSRLTCRSHGNGIAHRVQPFLLTALRQKHCGDCVAVLCSSRRHRAGGVQRTGPIRSISVIILGVSLASRMRPGISSAPCLKAMRYLRALTEVSKSDCTGLMVFGRVLV